MSYSYFGRGLLLLWIPCKTANLSTMEPHQQQ